MASHDYTLLICAGQRRHPTRLILRELKDWLEGADARLQDHRFHWRGGFPTLQLELQVDAASRRFEHRLIAWCEQTLDRLLFRFPFDETPLIAETPQREGVYNTLHVELRRRAEAERSTDNRALSAAVIDTDLAQLAGIKQALPIVLRELCQALPASPGELFSRQEQSALLQQKERLLASHRLPCTLDALGDALQQRFAPLREQLARQLRGQSPAQQARLVDELINRFGFSPRENAYLRFLASPPGASQSEAAPRPQASSLTPALAGL